MIDHPKDIEYFGKYPAPIMEALHANHFTNVNATITFFGPMMYFLARAICAEKILEIGHAEGYTAFYLANAVKDNGVRFNSSDKCRYYGIDIAKTEETRENLEKKGLLVTIINKDSLTLTPEDFKDLTFDIIFQDGCHDSEHILHELKVLYPKLRKGGFWLFHDCCEPAKDSFEELEGLIGSGVYDFEYVQIPEIHGLAILRKLS